MAETHRKLVTCALTVLAVSGCNGGTARAHREKGDAYFASGKFSNAAIEYRNVLKRSPDDAHATANLGVSLFEAGDFKNAVPALERARKLDPGSVPVLVKLGTVHYLQGRGDEARKLAASALELDDKSLDAALLYAAASTRREEIDGAVRVLERLRAHLGGGAARFHIALAELLIRKGDLPAAEAALAQATSVEPGSPVAHSALGRFYLSQKDLAGAEREFQQAAGGSAPDAPAKLALAGFYIGTGRPEEAKKVLLAVIEQAPGSAPAWRRLAALALQEGQLDECANAIDKLFAAAPKDPIGLLLRGELALRRRDAQAALADFTELVKMNPRFPASGLGLARAELLSGQVEEARERLRGVLEVSPGFADAALLLASLDINLGKAREAAAVLENLVEKSPSPRSYELLVNAYLADKQPDRAIAAARKLIALSPGQPKGLITLGLAYRLADRTAEARTAFEQALAADAGAMSALVQLVALDFAERRPDAALGRVQELVQSRPDSAPLRLLLGDVHQQRKELKEAEAEYLQAAELQPDLSAAYVRLVGLHVRSGRPAEAMARMEEAAAQDPRSLRLAMLLGLLSQQVGDRPRAIAAYENALQLNPRFVPALNNLAYLYATEKDKQQRALELAEAARQAAPDAGDVADTYGWVLYQQGKYQAALEPLLHSAGKLGDNPEVHYHLGMTYFQLGHEAQAREALGKALALAGSSPFPGAEEAKHTLARVH